MIYIKRKRAPTSVYESTEFRDFQIKLNSFYKRRVTSRRQERFTFEFRKYFHDKLFRPIAHQFRGKCAYCERKVDERVGIIDHFRPTSNARNLTKRFEKDYYWWLTYTWENLYLACDQCYKYKSSWFPVEGKRCEIGATGGELYHEKNLIIDPCKDRPEKHLHFTKNGQVKPKSKKGDVTIRLLALNRSELVFERRRSLLEFEKELRQLGLTAASKKHPRKISEELLRRIYEVLIDNGEQFLAIKREYLQAEFPQVFDLLKYPRFPFSSRSKLLVEHFYPISTPTKIQFTQSLPKTPEEFNRAYIERIVIKNFKSISDLTINFPKTKVFEPAFSQETVKIEQTPKECWLALLGENGVGKTSILQAITLAFNGQRYIDELNVLPKKILKHNAKNGFVKIYTVGSKSPYQITFTKSAIKSNIKHPPFYFLAYGSTRLLPDQSLSPESSSLKTVRAKNLFDPTISLVNPEKWLVNISNNDLYDSVAQGLKELLLLSNKDRIVKRDGRLAIAYRNGKTASLEELSDGYKSIFALTVDIMEKLGKEKSSMDTAEGVVLIDEIGTHLHPRWRMRIVNRLRNVFPRVQFIITTHDPLCLKGLEKGEVAVIKKTIRGKVIAHTNLPDPSSLRADQLLASDFFGLNSTVDPEIELAFDRYYYLLGKSKLSENDSTELNSLSLFLKDRKQLGESMREELMFKVIDKILANSKFDNDYKANVLLKKETLDRLESIWLSPETNRIVIE